MAIRTFFKAVAVALCVTGVLGHPSLTPEEMVEYKDLQSQHTEALGRCLESPHLQAINARMFEERSETVREVLKARGLVVENPGKRDPQR